MDPQVPLDLSRGKVGLSFKTQFVSSLSDVCAGKIKVGTWPTLARDTQNGYFLWARGRHRVPYDYSTIVYASTI